MNELSFTLVVNYHSFHNEATANMSFLSTAAYSHMNNIYVQEPADSIILSIEYTSAAMAIICFFLCLLHFYLSLLRIRGLPPPAPPIAAARVRAYCAMLLLALTLRALGILLLASSV